MDTVKEAAARQMVRELAAFPADTRLRLDRLTPAHTIKGFYVKGYLESYRREGGDELCLRC